MLMQQGAQMGVGGYYDPSKSQAQNYAAEQAATKHADTTTQANAAMTTMTIKLANLPKIAQQLAQGVDTSIQSQRTAKMAQDAMNIQGGVNIKANVADLISQLKAAGVQGGAALKSSLDAILSQAGVSKPMRIKIEADAASALATINGLHGKPVHVAVAADVAAAQAAIDSVHGKNVTITVTTINQVLTKLIGATTTPGSPAQATLVGAGNVGSSPARRDARSPGSRPGTWSRGPGRGIMFPRCWSPARRSSPGTWFR